MEVTSAAGQEVCEVAARNGQLDIMKLLFERRFCSFLLYFYNY